MNLAGFFGIKHKVFVVDGDQQGTATRWSAMATKEKPFAATVANLSHSGAQAHREIEKLATVYDYIFIDCPPSLNDEFTQSALIISDLVIIPVIPSPNDLWALQPVKMLIEVAKKQNKDLQARLLANLVQTNTKISNAAMKVITESKIDKFNTDIHLRTVYRNAAIEGTTVYNLNDLKAKNEISALAKEISKLLKV
jgi:chromosome partitioning protein